MFGLLLDGKGECDPLHWELCVSLIRKRISGMALAGEYEAKCASTKPEITKSTCDYIEHGNI